ncbi:hypothetical protein H4S02_007747 [Coemansia sp. RSA 2611]|nr:hypothetical protein H4S01_005724 [Coemansia sp. RSA 2610]KAJ2377087.1 hypothetical protein H4S02_007747 [Coemansia sp. RSA 2611]
MTVSTALSLPAPVRLRPRGSRRGIKGQHLASTTRTANAFSVPVAQLGEAHEPEIEESAQAQQALAVLPEPLRMLPYWVRNGGGARRCIVYLEPRRGSPLYNGIEEFFRQSAAQYGATEAHQYHPHSSMCGFIDLDAGRAGSVVGRIAWHLHALVAASGGLEAPRVRAVARASDYPRAGTHKLELQLDTPAAFRRMIAEVARRVPEAGVRPKRMGHISLAYCNKHVATDAVVTAEQAAALDALARALLYTRDVFDAAKNPWDVAFYELAFRSSALGTPHRFTQIARWQL